MFLLNCDSICCRCNFILVAMNVVKGSIFLLLFCCAVSIEAFDGDDPDYTGDDELAEYLRVAIENFRNQMKTGIPEIKMPVLDPLVLRNMDININENVASMSLYIHELTLIGLSTFDLHNIEADLENFFLRLNLSIPAVKAHGRYNLDGRIYQIFPIRGNGDFTVNATKVYAGGMGKLAFTSDTLQMDILNLDLTWEHAAMDFQNFLGNGSFSEVMQRLILGVGKDVYMRYKPLILTPLGNELRRKVNEELQKPVAKEIIKGILPID